jgi:hypothetical protein
MTMMTTVTTAASWIEPCAASLRRSPPAYCRRAFFWSKDPSSRF